MAEAHRLRVHVIGVDQLDSDDHDVVRDQAGCGTSPVESSQITARRAFAVGEVDQHLAVDQRNDVPPELRCIPIRDEGIVRALGDAHGLYECGFATRVVGARLGDMNRHAPDCVGRIWHTKLAAGDGRRGAGEYRQRCVVSSADEHDVPRVGDRLRQLGVAGARVIEHHIEQDHLRVQARQVVDHLGVYVVAPRIRTERCRGRRVKRDQGYLRRGWRRREQLVLERKE